MTDQLDTFQQAMTDAGFLIGGDEPSRAVQESDQWTLAHLIALARVVQSAESSRPIDGTLDAETLYTSLHDTFELTAHGVFSLAELLDALLTGDPDRESAPSSEAGEALDGYREQVNAAIGAVQSEQPWRANGDPNDVHIDYVEGDESENAKLARELEL